VSERKHEVPKGKEKRKRKEREKKGKEGGSVDTVFASPCNSETLVHVSVRSSLPSTFAKKRAEGKGAGGWLPFCRRPTSREKKKSAESHMATLGFILWRPCCFITMTCLRPILKSRVFFFFFFLFFSGQPSRCVLVAGPMQGCFVLSLLGLAGAVA